jgi:hypothetical protein
MSKLDIRAQAMVNYERAVACGDQEGIATRELARLYREAGDRHRAAECYHKHINAYGDEVRQTAKRHLFIRVQLDLIRCFAHRHYHVLL